MDDYVEILNNEDDVFVSPSRVNKAGNKLPGLLLPLDLDDAEAKEYADRVGVYARAHADRVGAGAREYVDRSTESFGNRFNDLPFLFQKIMVILSLTLLLDGFPTFERFTRT